MNELEKRILSSNEWGLITILHEAFIEKIDDAITDIQNSDFSKLESVFEHMRDILAELIITFKGDDELGASLRDLYIFINGLITDAFRKKDIGIFLDARRIIKPLFEAFAELSEKNEPNVVSGYTYGKSDLIDSKGSSFDIKK